MELAKPVLNLYNKREGKPADLMTIEELCRLLKVNKSYVYQLTHRKAIPHFKIGNHLRFDRNQIGEWLKDQEVRCGGN